MSKVLYIWDLANTLLPERWDEKKAGHKDYDSYLKSLGYDLKIISPREYEKNFDDIYRNELYHVELCKGFKEVLTWTKNNIAFTTGLPDTLVERSKKMIQKYRIDPRDYITELVSTFDFTETNVKTEEMIRQIINRKINQGYDTFVYTDDNINNCVFFLKAILKLKKNRLAIQERIYKLNNDSSELRQRSNGIYEVGSLLQLKKNEELLLKN